MNKDRTPWDFLKECREFAKKHGHHGSVGGFIRDSKDRKIAFGWKEYHQKFMTKKEKMMKIENPTTYVDTAAVERVRDAIIAKAVKDAEVKKKTSVAKNATLTINKSSSAEAPEKPIYENDAITFTFTPSPFQQEPWEKRAQDTMVRLMDYFWTSPHNSYLPIMAEIYKLLQERNAR